MPQFFVTYDVVTPESAESGDYAETGYAMPGGWRHACPPDLCGAEFSAWARQHALRLGEAIGMLSCLEGGSDGFAYYEADGRQDYRTGSETRFAFHLPRNTTPSSVRRVAALLRARHLIR